MSKADNDIKTIREHLTELRSRLFWVALVFGIGAAIGFVANHTITSWLIRPLGQSLYFSTPSGGLDFIVSISCIVGLVVALPIIIYQVVEFIRPAHPGLQDLRPFRIVLLASVCAASGITYAYYFGIPAALHFLINFAGQDVKPLLNASSYMNFVIMYLAGAALVFQIPLLIGISNKITPLKPGSLSKLQRPVILGAVIVAGIITPTPDPVNQMLLALPLIALFECTAFYFWQKRLSSERKARRRMAKQISQSPEPTSPLPNIEFNPAPAQTYDPPITVAPVRQPVVESSLQPAPVETVEFIPPSSDSIRRVRPSILRLAEDTAASNAAYEKQKLTQSSQPEKSVFYDVRPPLQPAS